MLSRLTIQNYALIRDLEMTPSEKLTVITGETGAGKSIMLGAIGLLLGNRADTKVLWDESLKCVTEAQFEIKPYGLKSLFEEHDLDYSHQSVLRREISAGGKSRAFINDTPVTLDVMREIGSRLMDVHSQHETLELGTHRFQLNLVDSYAGNEGIRNSYHDAWKEFQGARSELERLTAESGKLKAESDFINFQLKELEMAAFSENEQERLESDLKVSEHGEDIKTRLNQVITLIGQNEGGVQSSLATALSLLQPIRTFSPALEQLASRINVLRIELKDIEQEVEREEESMEVDPEKTKHIQERLDLLYGLLQKHRVTDIRDLLGLQAQFAEQARKTANVDEELARANQRHQKASSQLKDWSVKLRKSRESTYTSLAKDLTALLKPLGIPLAVIEVASHAVEPGPHGADQVELLFSANKGVPPKPLEAVASGGEFSRLMFCVKYVLAEKSSLPTLVLDEIDTGVSGEIAIQLATMMQKMAKRHQLITISHLPQIAARGDRHFLVYKDNSNTKTSTEIKTLTEDERVDEIAKMIGGSKPSTLARENARELLGV
ncbi:MAG: DNA repair protein RecN [Cyclobacteriaceae bacterium]|nr:DNA repair protein RecN [Cyclobacteriaceae bacterium]